MTPQKRAALARRQALQRATEILKQNPRFPAAQVQILDRTKELTETLTQEAKCWATAARLDAVLRQLDIRSVAYLELVTDMASQEAFMAVLDELGRKAWEEYIGYPIEVVQPVPEDKQFDAIRRRVAHWMGGL